MKTTFLARFCLTLTPVALLAAASLAGAAVQFDWPCFHGPDHNNISKEKNWLGAWPAEGPKQLWKANVGGGFSSVSVAAGRLYTMGVVAKRETVWCLDATTGKELWKHSYPYVFKPQYYEGGSSVTPTVDGNTVYSLGQSGEFFRFDAVSGEVLWSQNIAKELGAEVPTWGFASSPVVEGELLIVNVGTHGAAVNKATGKPVWTTGKAAAGYSSAVPFDAGGQRAVAFLAAREVVAVEAKTGQLLWQHPWKTEWDVNAADPVLDGGKVFISSSYGSGCALVQFSVKPPRELWRNKDMQTHFNSAVLVGGHLYGVDGEAGKPAFFKCLDWQTGAVKWSEKGFGLGAVTAADGKLILLSEKGELVIAEASPAAFKPLARAQVLGGKCWTAPVLSNGRVYCRNSTGDLVCVDVKGAGN
ncbi:MAG: PQQ-like beta-propeller repeat protein [Verrucomicrobia bacterium]|nr:PQQ-like beta-propeller repeat protein [Verrucomicrobiota bacterium]